MAYGSGPSLTGLSFTPYFAVYMSKDSAKNYYWGMLFFCSKDATITLDLINGGIPIVCNFGSNSVSFSKYNNSPFYNINSYTIAFGY